MLGKEGEEKMNERKKGKKELKQAADLTSHFSK